MVIQLNKLILILVRITSILVVCPSFSFKGLPNTFKIGLSFSLSIIVYNLTPNMEFVDSFLFFFLYIIKETLFGLAIGYVTKIIFTTLEIAGQLVDFQVGFSMASVYDPGTGILASNYGKIYYWFSICALFILDVHHIIIENIILSFRYVPINTVNLARFNIEEIVNLFGLVFKLGFNIALPMIIVVLVTDVVLGIISKTVPQINVLMLGMPLKALVSFIFTIVILSVLLNSIGNVMGLIPDYLKGFLNIL